MLTKETLVVAAIKHGTVIDHIPAGKAMRITHILGLYCHQKQISIGINLPSNILGRKDLIKVEDRELSAEEVNQIAIVAPDATISIVRDFEITKKFKIVLPDVIESIVQCTNQQCITNHESIETVFFVEQQRKMPRLRCKYCNQLTDLPDIQKFRVFS